MSTTWPEINTIFDSLEEIGRGGMGIVYRAVTRHRSSWAPAGQTVAVKVMTLGGSATLEAIARFEREARIGREKTHSSIVRSLAAGLARHLGDPCAYIAMEFVAGQSLAQLVAAEGPLPESLCRRIGVEIAAGLSALHAGGVLHRDLKPSNIMITTDEVVRVCDLGIAGLQGEAVPLTSSPHFLGTRRYAAPEQLGLGVDGVDHRTDLYSLGATLYELATGRSIPSHESRACGAAALDWTITAPQPTAETVDRPALPLSPEFVAVIESMLRPLPQDRPPSAATVRSLLLGEDDGWRAFEATSLPRREVCGYRPTPMFGRDSELNQLRAAYKSAEAGRGRTLLVSGPAGMGKSRLMHEFLTELEERNDPPIILYGENSPGGATFDLEAYRGGLAEYLASPDGPQCIAGLSGVARALALDLRAAGGSGEALESLTPEAIQTAFVRLTQQMSRVKPTVLLVEDLHFVGGVGREMFSAIAAGSRHAQFLLLGTSRHGMDEEWLGHVLRPEHSTQLLLRPLPRSEIRRIIVGAGEDESSTCESVVERADGNALFALELSRSSSVDGEPHALPQALSSLIEARLAQLAPSDRELLEIASCIGNEFGAELLAHALNLLDLPGNALSVTRALAGISSSTQLVRGRAQAFEFDYHVTFETLVASTPIALRSIYHSGIADALVDSHGSPVQIVHHLVHSDRVQDALPHLESAIEELARRGELATAVDYVGKIHGSLKLKGEDCPTDVGLTLLDLHARQGTLPMAIGLIESVSDDLRAIESPSLVTALRHAVAARIARREFDDARRAVCAAQDVAHGEASVDAIEIEIDRALIEMHQGKFREARLALSALAESERLEDLPLLRARIDGNLALMPHSSGQGDSRIELLRSVVDRAAAGGDRYLQSLGLANLSYALGVMGDHAAVLEVAQALEHLAAETGSRLHEALARTNLGIAMMALGQPAAAVESLRRGSRSSDEIGDVDGSIQARAYCAQAMARSGNSIGAALQLDEAAALLETIDDPRLNALRELASGEVAMMNGRHTCAITHFRQAASNSPDPALRCAAENAQAVCLLELGDDDGAARVLAGENAASAPPDDYYLRTVLLARLKNDAASVQIPAPAEGGPSHWSAALCHYQLSHLAGMARHRLLALEAAHLALSDVPGEHRSTGLSKHPLASLFS